MFNHIYENHVYEYLERETSIKMNISNEYIMYYIKHYIHFIILYILC